MENQPLIQVNFQNQSIDCILHDDKPHVSVKSLCDGIGIDANRVRPELIEKLIAYQKECFIVLHDYFHQQPQPTQPQTLPQPVNLDVAKHLNALLLQLSGNKFVIVNEMDLFGVVRGAKALKHNLANLTEIIGLVEEQVENICQTVGYKFD